MNTDRLNDILKMTNDYIRDSTARSIISELVNEIEIQKNKGKWKCFHCDFETSDEKAATIHFGENPEEDSLCKEFSRWDGNEKLRAFQKLYQELDGERSENDELRKKIANMKESDIVLMKALASNYKLELEADKNLQGAMWCELTDKLEKLFLGLEEDNDLLREKIPRVDTRMTYKKIEKENLELKNRLKVLREWFDTKITEHNMQQQQIKLLDELLKWEE